MENKFSSQKNWKWMFLLIYFPPPCEVKLPQVFYSYPKAVVSSKFLPQLAEREGEGGGGGGGGRGKIWNII